MPSKPELLLTFKLTIFFADCIEPELLMNKSFRKRNTIFNQLSLVLDTISNDCEAHFFVWKVEIMWVFPLFLV
jgi:hypothetical protein